MHPLLEALKPFAELFNPHDLHEDTVVLKIAGTAITAGDIRQAQATFKKYNVIPLKVTVEELEKILSEKDGTTCVDILHSGEMMVFKKEEKKNGS